MKSVALIVVLACASALAVDDGQGCKSDYAAFVQCMKDTIEKTPEAQKEATKAEMKQKVGKCFSQANCDAPDWDADPFGGASKPRPPGMTVPKAVKECLKNKMAEKIRSKLSPCLLKKGFSDGLYSVLAHTVAMSAMEADEKNATDDLMNSVHGDMKCMVNTIKAVDKCAQKNGGDTDSVRPLEQCLHNLMKEQMPKLCTNVVKPCDAKTASAECQKRGDAEYTAFCECKKEKEAEISPKLRQLGKENKKVGVQDVMKTMGEDASMQDIAEHVNACYKETKEEPSPTVAMALKMMSAGAGGPIENAMNNFSVNGSMVVIMSDMLALDAADTSECQACHAN